MKRKIYPKKDSKTPFYKIVSFPLAVGLGALPLTVWVTDQVNLPPSGVQKFIGIIFLIDLALLGLFLLAYRARESLPSYPVGKMGSKQKRLARAVKRRLNRRNLVDVLKLSTETEFGDEMPATAVYIAPDLSSGFIAIENMGRAEKLDRNLLAESISGILSSRKLRRFSVVSTELSRDQVFYIFHLEDTKTSQRLIVRNGDLEPFVSQNPHEIKLAKDLIWRVDTSTPFLAVIGRTRSGKSYFVAHYLLPLMKKQGWKVEFHSIKGDVYVKQFHGQSDPQKIIERLEFWVDVMKERNSQITAQGKEKYSQVEGMQDVALVIDEIGALNGFLEADKKLQKRWISAITQLTSTGASSGIHIIALAQYASVQGFLPSAAKTNVSDSVIFLGMAADSASDRQFLVPGSEIPPRRYATGQGLARIVTAGRRWESLHFYETPLFKSK